MYVVREDGSRQDLRYAPSTSGVALNVGWTVERHMKDDDIVLFNRQPSLHKMYAPRKAHTQTYAHPTR
jgi:DNA-directed RNA polymerase II subunit RPB1